MAMPRQYATTMLRGSKWRVKEKSASATPMAWLTSVMISVLTPRPMATPMAAATTEYVVPSNRNIWTRCRRLAPTARAMPISERRAAASITKMRKMSSTPTMMEKRPRVMKKVVTKLLMSSAASRMSRLISSTRNSARPAKRVSASRCVSCSPSSPSAASTPSETSESARRLTRRSLVWFLPSSVRSSCHSSRAPSCKVASLAVRA